MEEKENLFTEIFSAVLDFCKIKPRDIADCVPPDVRCSEGTIRSWRTRKGPCGENFYVLLDALKEVIANRPQMVECFKSKHSVLKKSLMPIWNKYSAPEVQWEESKGFYENIRKILSAAYERKILNDNHKKYCDSVNSSNTSVKRVVAFDLIGTLIKGFRYSWAILFKAIGNNGKEAVAFTNDFEFDRISYPEWCKLGCEILHKGGLTFDKVQKVLNISGASLTNGLREAIELLKKNECKVVIISGGADSILYSLIPDADELFDEIFINKLIYNDETGILDKIIPTLYDWDRFGIGVAGKQSGFLHLCDKYGVKPEDSVFVGDDFNDIEGMAIAGMKIFYYSYDPNDASRGGLGNRPDIRTIPSDVIYEPGNDLLRVANRIISWNFGDLEYVE